jgi:hypothetical protein
LSNNHLHIPGYGEGAKQNNTSFQHIMM